tara:strand:+ start:2321 stop:2509 length:189 start_codon:yes stop_codon:yes gene_type:complete
MDYKKQNPGGEAGVSRNQLGGCLQSPVTPSDLQVQMLAARFRMSASVAHEVARLCFLEARND